MGETRKKKEWEERGEAGEIYDPHADYIKPELLNETDEFYWKKIKDGTTTQREVEEYELKFQEETDGEAPDVVISRENFKALVRTKSIPLIIKRNKEKHAETQK